ncbi:MAG: succinylglutamate desuccinylase/aspartoacylase family protein [Lachnospiraceae bacterium]|nr:succinylglutamate desuccinylase/aspartoacylase family protein [Lachnospiraceae bacterium]MBP3507403.1 succinylglutamate desuccinylase/aspartoacylase family protein [Lachnospiraceae bacterium]
MIEEIASAGLPVDEELSIKKNRMQPLHVTGKEKRFSLVTGIHGDELEGQYVCYELLRRIKEDKEHLKGIVDVYPAMNPLGIDSITRGIPLFDLDMNRIFPGNREGSMAEFLAAEIIEDLKGSDLCMDVHASNIFLKEISQIRINEVSKDTLLPMAKRANVDYIWIHSASTVLESTLAYSLNSIGTPTLVWEMGVGMRITKEYGDQMVDGIFVLLKDLGIWDGEVIEPKTPIISTDGNVHFLNAAVSGIFLPCVPHWNDVKRGEHIGDIVDPLTGSVSQRIYSPCNGLVFTLREYPVVDEGSLLGRILER